MSYLKLIESGQFPVAFSEKLSPEASARELLAIGLRQVAGVEEEAFLEMTQHRIAELLQEFKRAWVQQGLIEIQEGRWKLTMRGRMLFDHLAGEIVSEAAK